MVKRSKLILFLSLVLCFTMLFASCDTPEPTPTTEPQTTTSIEEKPDVTLEDKDPNYKDTIDNWIKYIAYAEPESDEITAKSLFEYSPVHYMDSVEWHGNLVWVKTVEDQERPTSTRRTEYHKIYSANLGEIFGTDFSYTVGDLTRATIECNFLQDAGRYTGIVEVVVGRYDATEDVFTYTYSYYDVDKNPLPKNLTERPDVSVADMGNGDIGVVIDDKYYVCRGGAILYTFDRGEERMLPEITFEYAGYQYCMTGATIFVFDAEYELLSENDLPFEALENAENLQIEILDNGNLFLQWFDELDVDATEYDYQNKYETKYDLNQIIIDVATGEHRELEMTEFISEKELADEEKEKEEKEEGKTPEEPEETKKPEAVRYLFSNLLTNFESDETTVKINDGYQLAAAYQIVDGKVSDTLTFLVVDSNFVIKDELTKFWVNQSDEVFFAEANKLIVTATVMGSMPNPEYGDMMSFDETLYYAVNTNAKTVSLFVDYKEDYDSIRFIDGGFIYNDKLYNNNLEELMDLSEVAESIHNDKTITYVAENAVGEEEMLLCYIQGGKLVVKTLVDANGSLDWSANFENCYLVDKDTNGDMIPDRCVLYDQYGETLISGSAVGEVTESYAHVARATNNFGNIFYEYYVLK